jgi:geranylgeranyl pyrophosphate synthase
VREHADSADQARLLAPAFTELRTRLRRLCAGEDTLFCVCLPRLVYAAITGADDGWQALAVALLLQYLGTDLLDDLMDAELPPAWQELHVNEVALAAAELYAAFAPLALAAVEAPPATVLSMQRCFGRGLLRMGAGQHTDLVLTGTDAATSAEVEDSIARKSGAALAMYAEMAATLAGAPLEAVAAYAALGRELGTVVQIHAECRDLFIEPTSRYLSAAKRTLPLALQLERLTGQERARFLALLERARTDREAHLELREVARAGGVLPACAVIIEIHCRQAREELRRARPSGVPAAVLHELIDRVSLFARPHTQDRAAGADRRATPLKN